MANSGDIADDVDTLTIGAVADQLGVAPATLRSWERRYGIEPSARSDGGHRRYSGDDVARLLMMRELIDSGTRASAAATAAIDTDDELLRQGSAAEAAKSRLSGLAQPNRRFSKLPDNLSPEARTFSRNAIRLEADAMMGQLSDHCIKQGVVSAWTELVLPVLVAAGQAWRETGTLIDVEHVTTEAVVGALSAYRNFLPGAARGRPVVLACTAAERHTLALHAVAALACEQRIPVLMLGPMVPTSVAVATMARSQARTLFLWRQQAEPDRDDSELRRLFKSGAARRVLLGGPGWDGFTTLNPPTRVATLADTASRLHAAAQ